MVSAIRPWTALRVTLRGAGVMGEKIVTVAWAALRISTGR